MCREKKIDRIKRNTRLFSSLGETSLRTIKLDWATKKLIRGGGESSLMFRSDLLHTVGGRGRGGAAIFYYHVIITISLITNGHNRGGTGPYSQCDLSPLLLTSLKKDEGTA